MVSLEMILEDDKPFENIMQIFNLNYEDVIKRRENFYVPYFLDATGEDSTQYVLMMDRDMKIYLFDHEHKILFDPDSPSQAMSYDKSLYLPVFYSLTEEADLILNSFEITEESTPPAETDSTLVLNDLYDPDIEIGSDEPLLIPTEVIYNRQRGRHKGLYESGKEFFYLLFYNMISEKDDIDYVGRWTSLSLSHPIVVATGWAVGGFLATVLPFTLMGPSEGSIFGLTGYDLFYAKAVAATVIFSTVTSLINPVREARQQWTRSITSLFYAAAFSAGTYLSTTIASMALYNLR
jgi:hypothetical protein